MPADERDAALRARLHAAGQDHVWRFWGQLSGAARAALLEQLRSLNFLELRRLQSLLAAPRDPAPLSQLEPAPYIPQAQTPQEHEAVRRRTRLGEELIAASRVAAFTVAGGQGTRLGWGDVKGAFPIAPISGKSLFQLFAEQIAAWNERFGVTIPWLIMTSQGNHEATRRFFAEQSHFGLPEASLRFLTQGELPVLDAAGRLILSGPGELALSPDGHGGSLAALAREGHLAWLAARGIEYLYYFQVDNPLCLVLDPLFLGAVREQEAEAATKIVIKADPWERVGVLARRGARLSVIEYSELDEQLRHARDPDGRLAFRAGNIAIHIFRRDFLERLISGSDRDEGLPYHLAHKVVATVNDAGDREEPSSPNGYKFERFIFDVLGAAERHVALEVARAEEFEPLKNQSGANSPDTVRAALLARATRWCAAAGLIPPAADAHQLGRAIEINARTAWSAAELRARAAAGLTLPSGARPCIL